MSVVSVERVTIDQRWSTAGCAYRVDGYVGDYSVLVHFSEAEALELGIAEPEPAPKPVAVPALPVNLDRDETIARIKAALKRRSDRAWSVKGGRGTAWGWITVEAPPRRRTWSTREVAGWTTDQAPDGDPYHRTRWESYDSGQPDRSMSPEDAAELGRLFGYGEQAHHQGISIPASSDYYREFVDRAEGREPSVHAEPYWD
jgi:hypothetical protein